MNNESTFSPQEKPRPKLAPKRKWQAKPPEALHTIAYGQKSLSFDEPDSGNASQQVASAPEGLVQRDWKLYTGPESSQQIKARNRVEELKKRK